MAEVARLARVAALALSSLLPAALCAQAGTSEAPQGGAAKGEQAPQSDVKVARPVVVTATGFRQEVLDSPFTVQSIDSTDFIENSHRTVPESLRYVPGVLIQKTAHGHGSPFVRGFTGRQNLVLIDGIRFNNSIFRGGPVQYWNTVDGYSVDRIELIKSQGSVRYGSDAVGGTLNLLTKSADFRGAPAGKGFDHGMVLYRFDTNGASHTGRLEAQVGEGERFGLHVGATRRDFGDIRDKEVGTMHKTGYEESDYDLRFDYATSSHTTLTFAHQRLVQDDIWRTHRTVYFEPWHGTSLGSPDLARIYDQERSLTYLRWAGERLGSAVDNFNVTLSFQEFMEDFNRTRLRSGDTEVQLDRMDVETYGVAISAETSLGATGRLTYGADFYRDRIHSSTRVQRFAPSGALISSSTPVQGPVGDGANYDLVGAFAMFKERLHRDLEVSVGGRYTYAQADIDRLDDGAGNPISAKRDWDQATFDLRATFTVAPTWRAYLGIAQAFRAPNVDDLSSLKSSRTDVISTGSLSVAPEEFLTYELGARHEGKDLGLHAAVYYTDMKDLITSRPIGTVPGTGEVITASTNGSDGYLYGGELSVAYDLDKTWRTMGWVSYINGRADAFPTASLTPVREPVSRLMPLTGSIALRYDDARFWYEGRLTASAAADKLTSSDKSDSSRIPPTGTPGYAVVDLHGGFRATERVEFLVSLENVTDADYRIHGSGVNQPGINLILGGRMTW